MYQGHFADERTWPGDLHDEIAHENLDVPFKYDVHVVAIFSLPKKKMPRRDSQCTRILTKKLGGVHEENVGFNLTRLG